MIHVRMEQSIGEARLKFEIGCYQLRDMSPVKGLVITNALDRGGKYR